MKKLIFTFCLLVFTSYFVEAQNKRITGTIKEADTGLPIVGASVSVVGTKSSSSSGFDGDYSIEAKEGDILLFSYIGFKTIRLKVTGTTVNVKMDTETSTLNEVVVIGSLGRALDKSSLGYSVQTVKGQEVADTQRPNFANALQGRVAGLTVTSSTGAPGASATIQLRGVNSISSSNTPLYIVDGLPVNNETLNQGSLISDANNRNQDYTNRGADINPEDIESFTILKGPEAAALYGMQAGNGAIVITTKKGRKGVGRATYSTNTRLDQIYRLPKIQNVYQRGANGITNTDFRRQLGERFAPETKFHDNIGNFFKTGVLTTHNLSFEGGNENSSYRLSVSNLNQEGITPNTSYDRLTASLNATTRISRKFKSEATFNFTRSENNKASKGGSGGLTGNNGYLLTLLGWPQNVDVRDYLNTDGSRKLITSGALDTETDNPFWDVQKNLATDWNNRFITNIGLLYDPTPWLNITARVGWDVNSGQGFRAIHPESTGGRATGGFIETYYNNTSNLNTTLLATASKSFGKFNTKILLGNAINDNYNRILSTSGSRFLEPGFNFINNADPTTHRSQERIVQSKVIGFFSELNFDYDKIIFLSLTGRKDWTSVLPNPFFYPSASTSFMFTNLRGLKDKKTLSYGKIRVSYAEAANIPAPYSAVPVYQPQSTTNGGYAYGVTGANPNLEPEFRKAFEFGTELKFFNDRLGLDVSVYSTKTVDALLRNLRLSYGTGFVLTTTNFSDLRNEGLEVTVNATPIKSRNFNWDLNVNFNKTRSELLRLPKEVIEFYNSDTWLYQNVRGGVRVGDQLTTITAQDYLRNNAGQVLIDPSTGFPIKNQSTNFSIAGDRNPDFVIGFQNTFKYKNFSLSVLLDLRKGGDIFNATEFWMYQNGISTRTLDREQPRVVQGVLRDGLENTVAPTQNNIMITPYLQNEYYRSGSIDSDFIEKDINWLRMRDVTLSYRLPSDILKKTVFKSIALNVTMTDAFVITNYTGADPSVNGLNASAGGAGGVGFDFGTVSNPRGLNFGVRLGF
jgi:TonB-linked SusC/RagA family outer membrane protein